MSIDLSKYPIFIEQPVQWGEMDAFQHVNNTVYFKYFESIRIKFMEDAGMLDFMKQKNIGPILAKIEANFKIPVTYPDTIKIYLRIKSIGNSSFVVEHLVWSNKLNAIACIGDGVVVMLDYSTQSTIKIDDELKAILEKYIV